MATFPALVPSEAPITPGAWPVTATASLNGAESRIRHGSAQIGGRWRPQFVNITEANFLAIVAHYVGQRSGFDPFGFDTATLAADRTPADFAWLYAGPPQVVDQHVDCFTVACEFRCEPRGLVVAPGVAWRTGATTLTVGSRTGGVVFGPTIAFVTSATTLTPGARSDGASSNPGVNFITSATTLLPGTRTNTDVLVLRMNGANNSTTFTDDSSNALTVTPFVNAKISTAQSVSGGASGLFDGSSYLQIDEGTWADLTGASVVQASFYANSLSSSNYSSIIAKDRSGASFSWCIFVKSDAILIYTANTSTGIVCSATVSTGIWNSVRLVNNPGAGMQVFLNDILVSSANSVNLTNNTGEKVTIGCAGFNSPGFFFNGYIDDVIISKRI
jgi:hypothetical protein